jgi:hypothetical protein
MATWELDAAGSFLEATSMSPALPKPRLLAVATHLKRCRLGLCAGLIGILLSACGGGEPEVELRREPLAAGTTTKAVSYDPNDLYRFFVVAFGAAPGVTYMGQLQEAANAGMSIKAIVNVFTTKAQFLEIYPANLSSQEFAQRLVDNVVGTSATAAAQAEARGQVEAALASGMTRGDITYAIFNNLARTPANDVKWSGVAKKIANQVAYAKHYTETMKVDTVDLTQLRAVVQAVTATSSINVPELGTLIQSAVQVAAAQSLNLAPLARAVADRPAMQAGVSVPLDGRTSFDFEGRPITYTWRLDSRPAGSAASLTSTNSAQTSFVTDVPGPYGATLVVNDGVSDSTPSRVVVTALPAGALTAGQAVVTSLNTKACAALTGCAATVLSDFQLTLNQCTITKVGPAVALARPGMEPISAAFDGSLVDRAGISGQYLSINVRGQVATDQVNIEIDKDTGVVVRATGSSTSLGVTRSIDCKVVASGTFPATAAVPTITTVAELLKALDPRDCKVVTNGAAFAACGSTAVSNFSLTVGTCTLAKAGDTLTVSRSGSAPISSKLNGEALDVLGEGFDAAGASLGYITLGAADADPSAGSQQSITLRITPSTLAATITATDFRNGASNQISC